MLVELLFQLEEYSCQLFIRNAENVARTEGLPIRNGTIGADGFYFHRGHHSSAGSLCITNLDNGIPLLIKHKTRTDPKVDPRNATILKAHQSSGSMEITMHSLVISSPQFQLISPYIERQYNDGDVRFEKNLVASQLGIKPGQCLNHINKNFKKHLIARISVNSRKCLCPVKTNIDGTEKQPVGKSYNNSELAIHKDQPSQPREHEILNSYGITIFVHEVYAVLKTHTRETAEGALDSMRSHLAGIHTACEPVFCPHAGYKLIMNPHVTCPVSLEAMKIQMYESLVKKLDQIYDSRGRVWTTNFNESLNSSFSRFRNKHQHLQGESYVRTTNLGVLTQFELSLASNNILESDIFSTSLKQPFHYKFVILERMGYDVSKHERREANKDLTIRVNSHIYQQTREFKETRRSQKKKKEAREVAQVNADSEKHAMKLALQLYKGEIDCTQLHSPFHSSCDVDYDFPALVIQKTVKMIANDADRALRAMDPTIPGLKKFKGVPGACLCGKQSTCRRCCPCRKAMTVCTDKCKCNKRKCLNHMDE
eukprot:TRINITY_DN523_c0_g1_i1.p1 TRINITY_DN523_c0_g1~~TRINITY_DN523_c0_g1_i1.p1  ORF type:complete len:539 (+),score=75.89 TRINITY_DN523_c0_g1_i1:1236-2852(+)